MASYATSLQRSLIDRASALGSYIESLQTRNGRNDDGYAIALEMCRRYADIVQRQLRQEFDRAPDDEAQEEVIRGWAIDFFDRERWIDAHFARGSQGDVPRALKTMARREFVRHGLNEYEPVLTVGPPDLFETDDKTNLRTYLFENLTTLREHEDLVGLPVERSLAVISVPYIEGTRALWHPITLGHEIGHIRLESERIAGTHLQTQEWVDELDADLATLNESGRDEWAQPMTSRLPVAHVARATLQNWVDEILCDLNAVRLFGAAGVSAVAEFLAVVSSSKAVGPELPTKTHPPLSVRLEAMFHFLEVLGVKRFPPHASSWSDYQRTNRVDLGPLANHVATLIRDPINQARIEDYALSWGDAYFGSQRPEEIEWLRHELLDGIPGGTHCLSGERVGSEIGTADLVNAAWNARSTLDDPADSEPSFVLLKSNLTWHERRLAIDSLATKAIDSVEFAQLWQLTGGGVEDITRMRPEAHETLTGGGALLSRLSIADRFHAKGPARLVVTPLLEGSLQDAGIDLRLGPEFIVFRHSATGAFDALDRAHDPRMLQEALEKDWGVPFILHPGELVLASTLEYVVVPEDLAAQVVTRSSYGRLGLITATAIQVQPGSRGCITLELVNHADTPISLTPGARVAQLIFFKVDQPGKVTPGKYRFPVGPQFSKVEHDEDATGLKRLLSGSRADLERERRFGSQRALEFEITLPELEGAQFQEIAAFEGVVTDVRRIKAEVGLAAPTEIVARMMGGDTLVMLTIAGTAFVTALAAAVEKFVRYLSRGVIIEISKEGKANVTAPANLPRGLVIITAPPDVEVKVSSPTDRLKEITDGLRKAVESRQPRRDDWAFEKLKDQ